MPRFWIRYERPQGAPSDSERVAQLHGALQDCTREGLISEKESIALMACAIRMIQQEWPDEGE